MKLLKVLSASAVAAAVASTLVVAAGAEKAGLGFQTANWLFRNNLEQSKIYVCDTNAEEGSGEAVGDEYFARPGSFEDVTIDKDGTYTAKLTGIEGKDLGDNVATGFNVLKLYTNIVVEDHPDLVITLTSIKFAGTEMLSAPVSFDYVEGNDIADLDTTKPDANCADNKDAVVAGLAGVPIINSWSPDAEILDDKAGNFASDIEVTFDVTGYDKASVPDTEAPDDTQAPATDAPATEAPATTGDSTKPNTNTGVEGVAAVAGVALLAAGAVVVAKKRK
jgi:hypothetical protein